MARKAKLTNGDNDPTAHPNWPIAKKLGLARMSSKKRNVLYNWPAIKRMWAVSPHTTVIAFADAYGLPPRQLQKTLRRQDKFREVEGKLTGMVPLGQSIENARRIPRALEKLEERKNATDYFIAKGMGQVLSNVFAQLFYCQSRWALMDGGETSVNVQLPPMEMERLSRITKRSAETLETLLDMSGVIEPDNKHEEPGFDPEEEKAPTTKEVVESLGLSSKKNGTMQN